MVENGRSRTAGPAAKEPKERVVHTRFSAPELAAVEVAARQSEMSVSAFMRSLTLDGAGILPFLSEDDRVVFELLHRDLRAIGVNLNSLVRRSYQRSVPADAIADLRELQPLVAGLALELQRLASRPGRRIGRRD
jgi:hypothetical protein